MLVTITHPDLPGTEIEVEQNAYRFVWFELGWTSADDPTWEGSDVTPNIPHAGDDTIHGGGQEVDYAKVTTSITGWTVSTFFLHPIAGCVVTVPDLDHPVYLEAGIPIHHSAANCQVSTHIAAASASDIVFGTEIGASFAFIGTAGKNTSPRAHARLEPHTPGDYQLFIQSDTAGTLTPTVGANTPAWIKAVTG